MALIYNEDIFRKFKDLSIKSVDELVVGETVYSNFDPEKPMPILALITDYQNGLRMERPVSNDDDNDPRWVVTGRDKWDKFSLHDYNVLASYNPWLLFKTQDLARQCAEELQVLYQYDDTDAYLDRVIDRDFDPLDEDMGDE